MDRQDLIAPGGPTYVGTYLFAGSIAYDPKRFAAGKFPVPSRSSGIPGRSPGGAACARGASENLEIALLADGVAPKDLYPLDVERAFRSLDRIKPAIKKWIETTPQSLSLVTTNEIDFSYTYFSRVRPAQIAGSSVSISNQQTLNSLEYLAVAKGSRNREAAMRYIAFCLRPDRQAAFAEMLFFSPNSRKGFEASSPDARQYMPDMASPANAILNDDWWADRYTPLQKRFTEWLLV